MVSARITDFESDLTALSFNVRLTDDYSLIEQTNGFANVVLYNGEKILKKEISVGANEITFEDLTPNKLYQVAVVANYDTLSGDNQALTFLAYETVKTDALVLFDDVTENDTTLSWDYQWKNESSKSEFTKIELLLDGKKVSDLAVDAVSVSDLLSNRNYTVKATYCYSEGKEDSISFDITTYAKAVPEVVIDKVSSEQEKVSFEINVTDTDKVGAITGIKLLHGKDDPIVPNDLTARTFEGLLSDNKYTVEVTYTYDLNDGKGEQKSVITKEVKTLAKAVPDAVFEELTIGGTDCSGKIIFTDIDNIGSLEKVELQKKGTVIATSLSPLNFAFDSLDNYSAYQLVATFRYDANDGKGEIVKTVTMDIKTKLLLTVDSTVCRNTSAVSVGDNINLEYSVTNPSGATVTSVKINGFWYTVSSISTKTKIRVDILNDGSIGGNNTVLTLEEIAYRAPDNTNNTQIVSTNNTAELFINGKIDVIDFEFVVSYDNGATYTPSSFTTENEKAAYRIVLDNPTDYDIEYVVIDGVTYTSEQFTVSENVIIIPYYSYYNSFYCQTLEKIGYSNQYVGQKELGSNLAVDFSILNSNEIVYISTAEQLKDIDDGYYYQLTCDIDLAGTEWNPVSFAGILDGNGHSIKNMSVVKTFNDQDVRLGFISEAYGIIKDIAFTDIYYNLTLKGSTSHILGVGVIVCSGGNYSVHSVSVNGDVILNNLTGGVACLGYLDGLDIWSDNNFIQINLTNETIPEGAYRSYNARMIVLPECVTTVEANAFNEYSKVTVPGTLEKINFGRDELARFFTSTEWKGGIYYGTKDNPYLILGGKNESITDLTVHKDTRIVSNSAFENCTGLVSIILSDGLKSIGDWAFSGCSSLTSLNIPDGVTSIGKYAFYGCSALRSLNIPDGVTSIGNEAFNGCWNLRLIIFDGTKAQWNEIYKSNKWDNNFDYYTIRCTDGDISK